MAKTAKKQKKKTTTPISRYIKVFWILFGSGILLVFLIFFLTSLGVFGELPDETSLENPEKDLATQVISADGKTIGKFFNENNWRKI